MKLLHRFTWATVALCLLPALGGCSSEPASEPLFAPGSPLAGFGTAVMARDGKGNLATNIFSPSDPAIHTVIAFNQSAKGITVRCITIVENAGNLRNAHTPAVQRVVEQPEYGMDCIADRPADGWPVGTYRTEIYMGNHLAKRLRWEVR
jgi:hypothetical protein